MAKDPGGFGVATERLFPADYAAAYEAAGRLGWAPGWTNAVLREALAVVPLRLAAAHDGRTDRRRHRRVR